MFASTVTPTSRTCAVEDAPVVAPPADAQPVVVVIDDDAAVSHALKFSLELDGFHVRTYPDGDALLAAAALPERGCLVLDMNLPGMDGLELLSRLRERRVSLPAVLITSNPNAALRARAAVAGVPIAEKPLLTDALPDMVRRMMERDAH